MTNPSDPHDSRAEIAKASRVSGTQVYKVEYLLGHAHPALLSRLETGKVKIGKAYNALQSPAPMEIVPSRFGVLYSDLPEGFSNQRLRALPIPHLAAPHAAIFWWTHPCDLAMAFSCLRKWKFTYRSHFVLPLARSRIKDFIQEQHDLLLLATCGDVTTPALEDCPSSLLPPAAKVGRPQSVLAMIEQLFPNATRVQILPYTPREGWAEWAFPGGGDAVKGSQPQLQQAG